VTLPIDPSFATSGTEWAVPSLDGGSPAAQPSGRTGFGSMLADQLGKLEGAQDEAAKASQALATGQASDPEAVVMSVERAQLSMQLASTLRNKTVEAINDVFHTQV
jgi:flagellar hook-basal body complex protein FliE